MSTAPTYAYATSASARKQTGKLVWFLVAASLVHPMAKLLARYDWRADLLTHFESPAFFLTIFALVIALWRKSRIAGVLLLLLAAVQFEPLARYSLRNPVQPSRQGARRFKILMVNVLFSNQDYRSLSELIERETPDAVGLVEATPSWIKGLSKVREGFPYRIEAPDVDGATGLALWFRREPIAIHPPRTPIRGGWPYLKATIDWPDGPLELWLVHPSNPLRRRGELGNRELVELAKSIGEQLGPRVVVGDLNCTEGSPYFSDFLRESRLRDSRYGFGKQPSWLQSWPFCIPIDHAFVSRELAVVRRRLGPSIGSDHLPLVLEIAPAPAPANPP
jgi:endonuclease/exonuclease/phosphatase (EEP) superfamily protein YafD